MAESLAALEQCFFAAQSKVERVRDSIQKANLEHGKFSYNGLKLYTETVIAAYNDVNSFTNRIYLLDPKQRAEHEKRFVLFEEMYEFVRIALADMIQAYDDEKKFAEAVQIKNALPPVPQAEHLSVARAPAIVPSLLLQQNPLPTFDGRYENWHKFRDRFKDIVDKCVGDSPATKLDYLDKALVGMAKGSIDQQTLNDNNLDGAWRILATKYDNIRMVVQGHVTQLLSLRSMTKGTHAELKALLDVVEKRLESLAFHKFKMQDKLSEAIVVNLLISRLDPETRRVWETTLAHGEMPEYKKTMDELRKHCYVLERCEMTTNPGKPRTPATSQRIAPPVTTTRAYAATTQESGCPVCNQNHLVEICDAFRKMNVNTRYTKAKMFGLCFACLKRGHRTNKCSIDSSLLCECKKKHHPLMHWDEKKEEPERATGKQEDTNGAGGSGTNAATQVVAKCEVPVQPKTASKQVLLATAVVDLSDASGVTHKCRALLDSGAMVSFVSERMSDVLRLRKKYVNVPVVGVNGSRSTVKYQISVKVMSKATNYKFPLDCLVVPRVTGALPSTRVDAKSWPIPKDLKLADPKFYDPCRIDLLIGAEMFFELIQEGKIRMSAELPLLQESLLGWLVSGPVHGSQGFVSVQTYQVSSKERDTKELIELMKRFWTIDAQTAEPGEIDDCERHFKTTYSRDEDGRFIVELPFRKNAGKLGDSRAQAEKRFKALENRLEKYPETKKMYSDFVHEYIELGHARILNEDEKHNPDAYYLPHHCVLKPDSSSTKLRVVFDASAKTTTNLSLNDVLMEAPTVQSPLFDILLRWRLHKYVFTTDVQRMYRQVKVKENHTKYQRCVWRDERTQPLMDVELQRVTYGIGPAGFLATRSLIQLAEDERDNFPEASDVVLNSFYVDDALAGADTIAEATKLRSDLETMLLRAGFKLRKWCANDPELLKDVPPEDQEIQLSFDDREGSGVVKTLGLFWDPVGDDFLFRVKPMTATSDVPTKSHVLSEIARLFDPLGLLGPIVILAKMIMQRLWHKEIGWNDPIPHEEHVLWKQLRTNLCQINELRIPRRVTADGAETYELLGYSDASTRAYGCCIYLKSVSAEGAVTLRLLCAKSRVAPLKELKREVADDAPPEEATIPRLELCAACLLAEQVVQVREALKLDIKRVILRSDSKIVLCWLKKLKPDAPVFVKNRVARILKLTADCTWLYVNTKNNPADLVSRGIQPAELMTSELWWDSAEDESAAEEEEALEEPTEEDVVETVAVVATPDGMYGMIQNCSDFRRLERVFGHVTRFLTNCRTKQKSQRRSGRLNGADYRDSLRAMVKIVQHVVYHEEIQDLRRGRPLKGKTLRLAQGPEAPDDLARESPLHGDGD
ncbi:uncharacterized protein LOC128093775 [Culex pipiens pallens]|uniref:uncharacterized protein LOC128093775 n=1 Tax=Culex pipiens pallens TaxID=42434 RepID=UPI0022AADB61|nr:uncharacterized protein LOC128093775 [Culex pipiens pallens]